MLLNKVVCDTTLCRLIQDESDGREMFEACMPESPLLIQNLPLLIENMARKEPFTRSLAQKKRRISNNA